MQRAAQKGHMPPNRLAAGKTADGLVYHRLKDGGGKIFLCGALIDERLDIGLGKHAAAGRYGVKGMIIFSVFIEPGGVCL